MDEQSFWSSALGEWISDCVCGTSSSSSSSFSSVQHPLVAAESSWRSASNLELQLRYAELCDGLALNLVFCYLSSEQPSIRLLFLQQPQHQTNNNNGHQQSQNNVIAGGNGNVERSESLSSGVSSTGVAALGGQGCLANRLRQFQQLLGALCRFYRSKSLLILSLPDVLCIARSPVPELSGHEMHKLLALLLGAAVQSPQREHFIERIKRMRPEVQSELAAEIQRVSGSANANNSPVINLDSLLAELEQNGQQQQTEEENSENSGGNAERQQQRIVALIERVVRERDEFTSGLLEMAHDMEQDDTGPSSGLTTASSSCNGDVPSGKCFGAGANGGGRSPSPSAMDRHTNVELAAARAELRKLRNENEEKEEMLLELQDEVDKQRSEIGRLQADRLELVKDARAAKDLRDEMDCMQHKLTRLERLETENDKLRGRLGELDFCKSRVNHLKEDNKIMQETYRVMEEQLEQYQRKLSAQLEVESKLIEAQANNKSLQIDLTKTRERVEELLLENGRLERDLRGARQKCAELEREMHSLAEFASPRSNGDDSSLLAQLEAHSQSQILELQLENRKLKAQQLEMGNNNGPSSMASAEELAEARTAMAAAQSRALEKSEECARLALELDRARERAEEAAERAHKLQMSREQLDRQLAELRRASVPLKTHQKVMEQLETAEQKSQEREMHARGERDQLELARAEKQEMEAQLAKMCAQQRDARVDMDRLRERLEADQCSWERQRKALETERAQLKGRLEAAEAREAMVAQKSAETAGRRMAELEVAEAEAVNGMHRAEAELGQQRLMLDAETRKAQRWREELAAERDRLRDLLARLRSVCLMAIRSGGADESEQCCLDPTSLDDDLQLIAIIDDILMRALCSARREADALRVQQQKQIRELDDLKRDIQSLRRTGHELNASDDALLVENRNIKEQVSLLQDRLHRAHSEECTRAAELQAAKREIEELQQKAFANSRQNAELANAQMSIRNKQKQEELLRQELTSARAQLDAALKGHAETQKRLDSLELIHSALASDHDRLQNLHQLLSSDYDRVKRDKEALRQKLKGDKSTAEQLLRADFVRERSQIEQSLESERMERQREAKLVADLQAELSATARELAELKKQRTFALTRSDNCSDELRRLRMAESAQKTTINSLNVIIQQLNNALTEKDLELSNLRRQVEMLRQYNGDENRTLIHQIELLLVQNQQLHNRSDVFYAEQKELQEKLLTLRRHKEKLEEKIFEQYKQMDSRKLEPRPTFMKRAAKALISKSPSRRGRKEGGGTATASDRSDKSEESSIYSTENEQLHQHQNHQQQQAIAASPPPHQLMPLPPPPACPLPPRSASDELMMMNGGGADMSLLQASRNNNNTNGSTASSLYSSISSHYNVHHQHNASIDSSASTAIMSPLVRARNGRIGGSLRYPPAMARSFPSPAAWRNAGSGNLGGGSREFPETSNGVSSGGSGHHRPLPACCKVMQADTLPEESVEEEASAAAYRRPMAVPIRAPMAHQQQPRIIRELPPKPLPSNNNNYRPPPPPYPGQGQGQNNGVNGSINGYQNGSRIAARGCSPSPSRQPAANNSPYLGRQNLHQFGAGQNHHQLPPRDTSTPKSMGGGSGNSVKFHPLLSGSTAPSPIGFSRANSLALNGQQKPGTSSSERMSSVEFPPNGLGKMMPKESVEFHEKAPGGTTVEETSSLLVERPERAPSVYENVADKGAVPPATSLASAESADGPEGGEQRRSGQQGEIWYELGCV